MQPVEKKVAKEGEEGEAAKPKKAAAITFISDGKRSQNMGIAVSNFKKLDGFKAHGWSFVRDMLTDMRMEELGGQDAIDVLVQWKPEPAEKERCSQLTPEEIPRLAFSESFLYEVAKVPLLEHRLGSMEARGKLEGAFPMAVRMVEVFGLAVREVLTSQRLVEFLVDIIRPFGNDLNRSSAGRKEVAGIAIASLDLLSQVGWGGRGKEGGLGSPATSPPPGSPLRRPRPPTTR